MTKVTTKQSGKMPKLNLKEILNMTDVYIIAGLAIMGLQAIYFFFSNPETQQILYTNSMLVVAIIAIAYVDSHYTQSSFFRLARRVILLPLIFVLYSESQVFIKIINPVLYDSVLANWDLALFGCHPNDILYKLATPWLTEFLQFCYVNFFAIFLLIAIELHIWHKDDLFSEFVDLIFFSFVLMYLLYYIMPAIGPRFYLYDFAKLNTDLPGVYLTNVYRDFVNTGGGIPKGGVPNPQDYIYRDCMPSGHTWVTLICIYFVIKHRMKLAWYVVPIGIGLIFSTVYMRYHYLIDVLTGTFFAVVCIFIEPKIAMFFQNKLKFKNL
jgi:membrane-associated phospholipid phosphatase